MAEAKSDNEQKISDIQEKLRRKFDKAMMKLDDGYKCNKYNINDESDDDDDDEEINAGIGKKLENMLINADDNECQQFIEYCQSQCKERFQIKDENELETMDDDMHQQRMKQMKQYLMTKEELYKGSNIDSKMVSDMDSKIQDERYSWVTPDVLDQVIKAALESAKPNNSSLLPRIENKIWKIVQPKRRIELELAMKQAAYNGKAIKASGSQYAEVDPTFTNGMLIDMFRGTNKPYLAIDKSLLDDYGMELYKDGNLFQFESGASPNGINEILWNSEKSNNRKDLYYDPDTKQLRYKCLIDTIGNPSLCYVGTGQVGSLGYGIPRKDGIGGVSKYIISMQLLTLVKEGNEYIVKYYQIEKGSNKVNDKQKFEAFYDGSDPVNRPKIELIQDDNVFDSTINNVGLFGIIYSVFVEVGDAYFVERAGQVMNVEQFKNNNVYDSIINDKTIERCNLVMAPYTTVLTKYKKSPAIAVLTWKRAPDDSVTDSPPKPIPPLLFATGIWFANTFARLVPLILTIVTGMLKNDPKILDLANALYAGGLGNVASLSGNGYGFSSKPTATNLHHAIDIYLNRMKQIRQEKPRGRRVVNGPVAFRFAAPNPGILSMAAGNTDGTIWMEQGGVNFKYYGGSKILRNIGAPTYFYYILDELQKLFQEDSILKGKPHLGLYYSYKFGDIFRNVPESKMNIFIENYKKFNSTHIFSNQFSNNSGLDKKAGFPDNEDIILDLKTEYDRKCCRCTIL